MSELMPDPVAMKHYKSKQWGFSLDVPRRWNAFPAVPSHSPYEVIRFASHEAGHHLIIISRAPHDPGKTPQEHVQNAQTFLERQGFSNFVYGTAVIASRPAQMLDCDRTVGDGPWSCRNYFLFNGLATAYGLGFGSSDWGAMQGLFERVAQSFEAPD